MPITAEHSPTANSAFTQSSACPRTMEIRHTNVLTLALALLFLQLRKLGIDSLLVIV